MKSDRPSRGSGSGKLAEIRQFECQNSEPQHVKMTSNLNWLFLSGNPSSSQIKKKNPLESSGLSRTSPRCLRSV